MNLVHPTKTARTTTSVMAAFMLITASACGPQDYQKPIQGFADASGTVIAADRAFLNNENTIEQNNYIDSMVFERMPFGPKDIEKQAIITPAEINLRTNALDALSQYTTNLATLAQGKAASSVGTDIQTLGTNLQSLAKDASTLANPNPSKSAAAAQAAFNTKFSGVASAAASAISAVATLIINHKARTEIEKSVKETDPAITALIELISTDAQDSYERQKTQLENYGLDVYKMYQCEVAVVALPRPDAPKPEGPTCRQRAPGVDSDPASLLSLADRIKSYSAQQATLANANPAPAIAKMQKAHQALVAYVSSKNSPTTLSVLVADVQNFITAALPLGQAVEALVKASK